ncbi:MAG: hypothetical protein IKS55_15080 [Oscillospiraceae bacterium]|nr:hypothetical protein [Oscillospiraceae bacterium]
MRSINEDKGFTSFHCEGADSKVIITGFGESVKEIGGDGMNVRQHLKELWSPDNQKDEKQKCGGVQADREKYKNAG